MSSTSALASTDQSFLQQLDHSPLVPSPDLLIIGAELTGLALASLATDKGWKVQVLADSPLTATISNRLPGLIWPSSLAGHSRDEHREFAFYCRDLWSRLTVRPGMEFDWKVPGILALGNTSGIPGWTDRITDLQADGWSIQSVDAQQLQSLLPGWNRPSDLGLFFPADGQLDPLSASLSFAKNLTAKRSSLRTSLCLSETPQIQNGHLVEFQTSAGTIRPRFVLFNNCTLPVGISPVPTCTETFLSGFVPLTSPACSLPIFAELPTSEQLTIVPRATGCDLHLRLNTPPSGAPVPNEFLAEAFKSILSRWETPSPPPHFEVSLLTRTISSTSLPLLRQHSQAGNAWWTLPDSTDTLYSVGLAQQLLDWMLHGERPEQLDLLA